MMLQPGETMFRYNDEAYAVSLGEADHRGRVILPDGTTLQIGGWLESLPPQIGGLTPVANPFDMKNYSLEEVAEILNAAVARKLE